MFTKRMHVMTPKATSCLRSMYVHNLSHCNISYKLENNNILKGGWLGISYKWSDVKLECQALYMYLLFIATKTWDSQKSLFYNGLHG